MRTLACLAAILVLASPPARAGMCNLRWSACWGDGGAVNRDFACDTNSGTDALVATFVPPTSVNGVVQIDAFVNLAFAGTTVPPWWQFGIGSSCRSASLSIAFQPPATATACVNWNDGTGGALTVYIRPLFTANSAQIEVQSPVVPDQAYDLVAGQEYIAFVAVIDREKTAGAGSCSGCTLGA